LLDGGDGAHAVPKAPRAEAAEADAGVARIAAAERALPGKMVEADERIVAAAAELDEAADPRKRAVMGSFVAAMQEGVGGGDFRAAMLQGYALAAAGFGTGLDTIEIPHPVARNAPLLRRGLMSTADGPIGLAGAWQTDPRAAALHAEFEPLHRVTRRLQAHLARIGQERERALSAANQTARSRSFEQGHGVRPAPSPPPTEPWKPAPNPTPFVPPVYRDLGTPVPTDYRTPAPSEGDWSTASRRPVQR
jgi:hypothetical protein